MGARTPPLRLKVERQGGSDLIFTAVDPGARIWAVGELHPRTRTPPPSLKGRKARGVRLLLCTVDLGAQIRTARSCLLLTLGASSPETLDKWVLTHSLISKPPKREISLTFCRLSAFAVGLWSHLLVKKENNNTKQYLQELTKRADYGSHKTLF
jgi:hypothetical protein